MTDFNRVRAGGLYRYNPLAIDRFDRPYVNDGDTVRVIILPGCPKANTMGHAHIELFGTFGGLVCTNSLCKGSK